MSVYHDQSSHPRHYDYVQILTMSGLPATSFRIGQITGGAPRGAWSTTDWVPIIVKSSVTLGALPQAHGVSRSWALLSHSADVTQKVASWLPPHAVSDAIVDVAFAEEEPPLAVNLVHPRPIAWKKLMQPIAEVVYQQHLTSSLLPLIPFGQWVTRLNACAVDTREANIKRVVGFPIRNTSLGADDVSIFDPIFYFIFILLFDDAHT